MKTTVRAIGRKYVLDMKTIVMVYYLSSKVLQKLAGLYVTYSHDLLKQQNYLRYSRMFTTM